MKTSSLFLLLLFPLYTLSVGNVHAQMYKWVDADGKIFYSDSPPPPSAKKIDPKPLSVTGDASADLPYELNEAVKTNPVTLYTTTNCPGCEEARSLLKARGIPFSEKTVNSNEDIAKLKQAGGGNQLPFLTVGRYSQQGFEANAWHAQLTSAGYPKSNMLPKSYRAHKVEAAAPSVITTKSTPSNTSNEYNLGSPTLKDLPPPVGDHIPPGFRF